MIKTLRISFSLRNTCRVNAILHSLKQIPLIRKILPDTLYSVKGLKVFANIISILWEVLSFAFSKFLYVSLMIFIMASLYEKSDNASVFLHILLFLTIIGAFVNTYMFNPTKDKYYALILMRMNAREYTLVNYGYAIFKTLLGFLIFGMLFGLQSGLSVLQCIMIPFFVAGIKLTYAAYILHCYNKTGDISNENKFNAVRWILLTILLAAAYVLPIFRLVIPATISTVIMLLPIITGIFSLIIILGFKDYYTVYRQLLTETVFQMDNSVVKALNEQTHNLISTDTDITSNKKGSCKAGTAIDCIHDKYKVWQESE